MLLAIDVGNTNMVFGMFEGETFTGSFRLMTDTNRTSDEIGLSAWEYFQRFGLKTEDVENVIIASVVPQVMHTLTNAMVKYFGKTPIIVDEDVDPGLPYGVSGDERLGADRSVACIAALEKYGAPLVVLDFGTATTFGAIDEEGSFLGGCICPGLKLTSDALVRGTAKLPRFELVRPEHVISRTTVTNLQSGVINGFIGQIEYLVRKFREELHAPEALVVATGGMAVIVAEEGGIIDKLDGILTLKGLRLLYERNR